MEQVVRMEENPDDEEFIIRVSEVCDQIINLCFGNLVRFI